jgi:hypothetical protein
MPGAFLRILAVFLAIVLAALAHLGPVLVDAGSSCSSDNHAVLQGDRICPGALRPGPCLDRQNGTTRRSDRPVKRGRALHDKPATADGPGVALESWVSAELAAG